jgi:hypothetical protein
MVSIHGQERSYHPQRLICMNLKTSCLLLLLLCLAGCQAAPAGTATQVATSPPETRAPQVTTIPTASEVTPPAQPTATASLADYAFPEQIDPAARYLFYLHGKIIEDQGLPAVSPDFGEYEYGAILKKLSDHGFRMISEPRPRDTDPWEYAQKVAEQVNTLLAAGVPAENITVVGASKGAGIAIFVSNLVKNEAINYVPMAICTADTVAELIQAQVVLYGNVLSIYDSTDEYAGSCEELFAYSRGKGIARHEEIVLELGMGHGILYQPLDEWVLPVAEWAGGD